MGFVQKMVKAKHLAGFEAVTFGSGCMGGAKPSSYRSFIFITLAPGRLYFGGTFSPLSFQNVSLTRLPTFLHSHLLSLNNILQQLLFLKILWMEVCSIEFLKLKDFFSLRSTP